MSPAPDDLHGFALWLREPRPAGEVRAALAILAGRLAGSGRAECSLETLPAEASAAEGLLRLPLRYGGRNWGELEVCIEAGARPERRRALEMLATLGAAALSSARPAEPAGPAAANAVDPLTGLYGPGFVPGFLVHALAQARRRAEPLSLLCIAPDRLEAIGRLLGPDAADGALARVARAVAATLRTGDVVARLDAGRLLAILPAAPTDAAPCVGEAVRRAVAEAGRPTAHTPILTASVGVASCPADGHDAATLRAAATAALALARRAGDCVVAAPRLEGTAAISQKAG